MVDHCLFKVSLPLLLQLLLQLLLLLKIDLGLAVVPLLTLLQGNGPSSDDPPLNGRSPLIKGVVAIVVATVVAVEDRLWVGSFTVDVVERRRTLIG